MKQTDGQRLFMAHGHAVPCSHVSLGCAVGLIPATRGQQLLQLLLGERSQMPTAGAHIWIFRLP